MRSAANTVMEDPSLVSTAKGFKRQSDSFSTKHEKGWFGET